LFFIVFSPFKHLTANYINRSGISGMGKLKKRNMMSRNLCHSPIIQTGIIL
jgi:hypothetical protein